MPEKVASSLAVAPILPPQQVSSSASAAMTSKSDFFALSFPDPSSYPINITSVGSVGGSMAGFSGPTHGVVNPSPPSRGSLLQEDMMVSWHGSCMAVVRSPILRDIAVSSSHFAPSR